jgi:2-phospho-L-lactate guanylyltransferase
MAIYAVVPVKTLNSSKMRLSTVFTPQERQMLTLAMLKDVLIALRSSIVDKVVVVGEDTQVKEVAETLGASYRSANRATLNPALNEAASWCTLQGATSVLILPADIPLLETKDINRIIELGKGGNSAVVLSPSQNWGTNALYQNPPNVISACFGPRSFLNHIREAYQKGVSVRLHFSQGLATDIDSAEDLKKLFESKGKTESMKTLREISLSNKIARDFLLSKTSEK